jgi:hypothetical protein
MTTTATMARSRRTEKKEPTKADQNGPATKLVRVDADMADMMGWIARLKGGTVAQLVNRVMRAEVEATYKSIKGDVEAIRQIEEKGHPK